MNGLMMIKLTPVVSRDLFWGSSACMISRGHTNFARHSSGTLTQSFVQYQDVRDLVAQRSAEGAEVAAESGNAFVAFDS